VSGQQNAAVDRYSDRATRKDRRGRQNDRRKDVKDRIPYEDSFSSVAHLPVTKPIRHLFVSGGSTTSD